MPLFRADIPHLNPHPYSAPPLILPSPLLYTPLLSTSTPIHICSYAPNHQCTYASTQGQLGRRNDVIRKRWQTVLCKRTGGVDLSAPPNPSNPSSSSLDLTSAPAPDFNQFEFLPIPVIPIIPTSASIPLLPLEYVAEIASAAAITVAAEVPQSLPM
jgi:hypothetical protein